MRRDDFLNHVAWTGAGIAYALSPAGILTGRAIADAQDAPLFVQISDSHIGFHQPANPDVSATLQDCVDAINAMPAQPAFVVHTGDNTNLSSAQQFDDARAILSKLRAPLIALPGEHDVIGNDFATYLANFKMPGAQTGGWTSWEREGVHYVALLNVFSFETMGLLGNEQLDWLKNDLSGVATATPIVVFTHVPLYALYSPWGWTTEDGAKALAILSYYDRVTVLNGHIHQIVTHVEGNIRFASPTPPRIRNPRPAPHRNRDR